MENLMDQIQPYVSEIVKALFGILALILMSFFAMLKTKIKLWIVTKTAASQRELFHKIANEAFAHAETVFKSETSRNKLNKAFIYASAKLSDLGINVTAEEIHAAIEKACLEHNANKSKIVKEDRAS